MSKKLQDKAKDADLKLKYPIFEDTLTLNDKCVKNCYPMQIYLKKIILQ
jgi:hypothetical protein